MATKIADGSRVGPICPHKTGDVVGVVRRLADAGYVPPDDQTPVAGASATIRKALNGLPCGVRLVKFRLEELTEQDLAMPDRDRLTLRRVIDSAASVRQAMQKNLAVGRAIDVRANNLQSDPKRITVLVGLVLTNTDDSKGQLSHPTRLLDEVEAVEAACATIPKEHQVRFLEELEIACRNAHSAGAGIAAVAIRDVGSRQLEFEAFFADSDYHYGVQEAERRGSQRCVKIPAYQHDMPE